MPAVSSPIGPDGSPREKRRRDLRLWVTFLGAPLIWLTHLQLIYSLSLWSMHNHNKRPLHFAPLLSILLCALVGWLTWRTHRNIREARPASEDLAEAERVEFMSHVAAAVTVLFILGVLGQWVALLMIDPSVD